MVKDDRLHKILIFITKETPETNGVKYDWKYEELMPVISSLFNQATVHKVRGLCSTLIEAKIIEEKDEWSFNLSNLEKARQARDIGQYEKESELFKISNILLFISIIASTVLGYQSNQFKNELSTIELTSDSLKVLNANNKQTVDSLRNHLKHLDKEINNMNSKLDTLKQKQVLSKAKK